MAEKHIFGRKGVRRPREGGREEEKERGGLESPPLRVHIFLLLFIHKREEIEERRGGGRKSLQLLFTGWIRQRRNRQTSDDGSTQP